MFVYYVDELGFRGLINSDKLYEKLCNNTGLCNDVPAYRSLSYGTERIVEWMVTRMGGGFPVGYGIIQAHYKFHMNFPNFEQELA
jgi:hypothetical protein